MEVDWVSGACMVVRRKAVDDIGLMDERFFLYWEDADWCKRMWKKGWKVVYFPQGSVVHYVGGSSTEAFLRSSFEFHKSSYKLFEKQSKDFSLVYETFGYHWNLTPALFSSDFEWDSSMAPETYISRRP